MALVRTAVGKAIYVWSSQAGRPSPGTTHAVISAHGRAAIINSTFRRGYRVTLHYYNPHGTFLLDPGLGEMMRGSFRPVETQNTDTGCQDYSLSKFQGSHGNIRETYDSIEGYTNPNAEMEQARADGSAARIRAAAGEVARRDKIKMDVITIRNVRKGLYLTTLSFVLRLLRENGFGYTDIHCSFCRGGVSDMLASLVKNKSVAATFA